MVKFVAFVFPLLLLPARPLFAASDSVHPIPKSLDAQRDLQSHIVLMQERSSTFREQCRRIDVGRLHVKLRTDTQLLDGPFRGRSVIRRSEAGVAAWVMITPFGDPTEWIAHELEHVIEQIEGLSVPTLALASTRSAWRTADNMFETERALRAGRTVLHEVQDAGRAVAHTVAHPADAHAGQGD